MTGKTLPEWSHMIAVDDISGDKPMRISIQPNDEEIHLLEKRLGLLSLNELHAELVLTREQGRHTIHVQGKIVADLVQSCVVSIDPVQEHVEDQFDSWFAEPDKVVSLVKARRNRKSGGEKPILSEQDDPEPIIDGQIDVGELATQYLSLFINPYPHAESVRLSDTESEKKASTETSGVLKNPFAALKEWKERQR